MTEPKLNQKFAGWIDSRVGELTTLLEDLSSFFPPDRPSKVHPDRPIEAHITDEDILGLQVDILDQSGRYKAISCSYDTVPRGFSGANLDLFLRFVERISGNNAIRNVVSEKTIRKLVIDQIDSLHSKRTPVALSSRVEELLTNSVEKHRIFIPVTGLHVDGPLRFGSATFTTFTTDDRETLRCLYFKGSPEGPTTRFEERIEKYYLGRTVAVFDITAERQRAIEIADEKAERYLALMHFFSAPIFMFPVVSHVAPANLHPWPELRRMLVTETSCYGQDSMLDPPWEMEFTRNMLPHLGRAGFGILSKLADDQANEFQRRLISALLVYGRACYQLDPSDKLLQITTAFEMLALRDSSEPIGTVGAHRLAFAVFDAPDERRAASENFKEVYKLRSKRTHSGRTIDEVEEISIFLKNVWSFMYTALTRWEKDENHDDFLKYIDDVMYGNERR